MPLLSQGSSLYGLDCNLAMADCSRPSNSPRQSSSPSLEGKWPQHDKDCLSGEAKKWNGNQEDGSDLQMVYALASRPSQDESTVSGGPASMNEQPVWLTGLLSCVIEKT